MSPIMSYESAFHLGQNFWPLQQLFVVINSNIYKNAFLLFFFFPFVSFWFSTEF